MAEGLCGIISQWSTMSHSWHAAILALWWSRGGQTPGICPTLPSANTWRGTTHSSCLGKAPCQCRLGGGKRAAPGGDVGRQKEVPPSKMAVMGVSGAGSMRQATLHEMAPVGSTMTFSWQSKGKAQQAATCLITKTLALLGLPLSVVESQAFHRFLHLFVPWYDLPSQRTWAAMPSPSGTQAAGRCGHSKSNAAN